MAGMIEAVGTRKSEKGEMMQGNDKSRNLTKALVVCGVALALLGGSASAHAETPAALDVRPHSTFGAQATEVASGTWGTCPWVITSDGVLEIYAGEVSSSWSRLSPWSQYAGTVTSVKTVCASGERVVVSGDLSYLFADMEKVTSVDLSGWDTTAVTNMDSFFSGCAMLTSPSFAGWDFSQVADLEYLFSNCSSLDSLDICRLWQL
jgi:surface protein